LESWDKGRDHDGQGYKVGYLQGWFKFNFDWDHYLKKK
jgi:hypothetical protein